MYAEAYYSINEAYITRQRHYTFLVVFFAFLHFLLYTFVCTSRQDIRISSAKTYTANRLSTLENNQLHYYNVISDQDVSLGSRSAHQTIYGSACNGTACTITNYEIFTVQPGVNHPIVYTIRYSGYTGNYNDSIAEVNQMVNSFTISSTANDNDNNSNAATNQNNNNNNCVPDCHQGNKNVEKIGLNLKV
ncbi:MAG: hypothetical protein WA323_06100 [Candidatus Nitrosopolaris sp.]